ncbi:hypothetical protein T4B_2979 [Trichinella pseudospiralis]|uniref:Uncharacterized protein n=2 Tax=Trichinella pseudospiralis TaxID=6337 RepID=A0A0V1G2W3_TRIPS|nr:hypothetical protein T4D_9524 [Trichinella pseudospiralis]KRZ34991.1 hypothetical protein T4B_2979 [Trichinella pseudospiralis]KRZ44094.1 hypothetical protein T4C_2422 [Trichinella pseudospiralis]
MAKAVRRELSRPGPGKGYLLAGVQKSPPGHLRQEQFSGSTAAAKRRPGIGCAQITVSPREAPLEEAVGEGTETDSGKLEACERALVDKAECSTRNRRVLRSLLQRYEKVISCVEADLRRTNLVQHRIETRGAQPKKLPPRRLPQAQRETVDRLIREMLEEQRRSCFINNQRPRPGSSPAF